MAQIGYILTMMCVSFATWSALSAGQLWLRREESTVVRVLSAILWTAVLIAAFALLFSPQAGGIAFVTSAYRYLAMYAMRNRKDKDDDDDADKSDK